MITNGINNRDWAQKTQQFPPEKFNPGLCGRVLIWHKQSMQLFSSSENTV
jgi:hypothetical protein